MNLQDEELLSFENLREKQKKTGEIETAEMFLLLKYALLKGMDVSDHLKEQLDGYVKTFEVRKRLYPSYSLYTIHKAQLPYTLISTDSINSNSAIEAISKAEEGNLIYSGFGGQIIKKEVFDTGKTFVHVHSGILPNYRGSTTVPSGQNSKDNRIKSSKFNSGIAGSKLPIDFSGDRITANRPYPNLFLKAVEIRQRLG